MLEKLRSILFGNIIIKALSLLFAVALWFHVVARGKSEVNFVVPLELKDIPQDMVVVGDVPGYVDVRLLGQEGILKGMYPRDISAFINLSDAKEGEDTYYLGPSNIRVPGNITVSSVNPIELRLHLEYIGQKDVPVKPVLEGKPAPGYRVSKVSVTPASIMVHGPNNYLAKLTAIKTEPIEVEGAAGNVSRQAAVEPISLSGLKLDADSVTVEVTVVKGRR